MVFWTRTQKWMCKKHFGTFHEACKTRRKNCSTSVNLSVSVPKFSFFHLCIDFLYRIIILHIYIYSENEDPCEKAYQLVKCYVEFHPEVSSRYPNLNSFPDEFLCYIRVTGFADRPFPLKLLTERVIAAGETLEYIQEKETNSVFA